MPCCCIKPVYYRFDFARDDSQRIVRINSNRNNLLPPVTLSFFYKNVVFPVQAEYSYFFCRFWMVQHRFGGMRDESKNGGGMRDDRNFNSGMRDENRTAGPGYVLFCKWDRIYTVGQV